MYTLKTLMLIHFTFYRNNNFIIEKINPTNINLLYYCYLIKKQLARNSFSMASMRYGNPLLTLHRILRYPYHCSYRSLHSFRMNIAYHTSLLMRNMNNTSCCILSSYMCNKSTQMFL